MKRNKAGTARIIVVLLSLIMVLTTVMPYAFAAGEGADAGREVNSEQVNQSAGKGNADGADGQRDNASGDAGDTDGADGQRDNASGNANADGAVETDAAATEDGEDADGIVAAKGAGVLRNDVAGDEATRGDAGAGSGDRANDGDTEPENGDAPAINSNAEVPFSIPRVLITIKKGKGDNTEVGQAAIDAMNASENHSYKCTGSMDIHVPEGFSYVDSESGATLSDQNNIKLDYMRGRGNTSWNADKKPYKIKLKNERSLLGMDTNDSWALLANAYDPSLNRNRVTLWLGRQLGMEFTPQACPVDLFVGGDNDGDGVADEYTYYGSYLLTHIPKDYVDIDTPDETVTDGIGLTGGYLLSMLQDHGSPDTFKTRKDSLLQNIEPVFDPADDDHGNDTQKQYIRKYVQEAEDALFEGETKDPSDPSGYRQLDYRDYFDLDAAALYWIVQEFSNNTDAYLTGSTYFYKKRDDQGGKIYWGPLWDFDYGWDDSPFSEEDTFNTQMYWMVALLYDKSEGSMYDLVKKDWPQVKAYLQEIASADGEDLLKQYYEETKLSQAADYAQNYSEDSVRNPAEDYEKAVDELRQWIIARVNWMDKQLNDLDTFSRRIVLKDSPDDEHPQIYYRINCRFFEQEAEEPDVPGKVFLGWYVDDDPSDPDYGKNINSIGAVKRDITATARYIDADKATKGKKIYFSKDVAGVKLSTGTYFMPYTVVPEDAQDKKLRWKSSDESIATVDKNGEVTLLKAGEVTITATLSSGISRSYRLVISDKNIDPVDVKLSHSIIYMRPGDVKHLDHTVTPENATGEDFFESYDYDVAKVNPDGTITAIAPGRAKVALTVYGNYAEDSFVRIDRECIVIVSDKEGRLTTKTETKGVSGKATNLADVADAVLTSEDKENKWNGADVKLWLKMAALDENSVAAADKNLLLAYVDSNGLTAGKYLDISLFKKIGEFATEEVHESSVPVKFRVKIPKELRLKGKKAAGKVRTFYLLRVHDGKVDCVAKGTGDTLECSSSLFSTYLLAYKDSEAGAHSKSVNTGDENTLYLWAGIMVTAMILCLLMFVIKRKRHNRSM